MDAEPFLTPSVRALLKQVNANAGPADYTAEVQRAGLINAMAVLGWPAEPGTAKPEHVPLPSGASVYLFRPDEPASGPQPTAVYIHGGSFMAGGIASHAPVARAIANRIGAMVALVDYRLAPEARAPAALDDCFAAIEFLRHQADAFGLAADRLVLVGDSAGGGLAAATALRLRDVGGTVPRLLVLINPMTSPNAAADRSMTDFASGYFAGAADFEAGWRVYDSGGDNGADYDLLTVRDLSGLPLMLVVTNEADPVRDQGETFAMRASAAGSTVLLLRARGLVHASWLFPKVLPEADLLMSVVTGAIRAALVTVDAASEA